MYGFLRMKSASNQILFRKIIRKIILSWSFHFQFFASYFKASIYVQCFLISNHP